MFESRVATLIRTAVIAAALAGFAPPASADPRGELDLLILGDTDAPPLVELMKRHRIDVAHAEDPQQALNKLAGVDALLVDVAGLDEAVWPGADAIIDLAHRTGIAVVAVHASSTDMARWVGLGFASDIVVLGTTPDGRAPKLEIVARAGAMDGVGGGLNTEVRVAHLEEAIRSHAAAAVLKTTGPQRINYKAWFLGGDILEWTPSGNPGGSNQLATVNISYQVELVANSELNQQPNARYVKISTLGTGMSPGSLPSTSSQDENRERGWFQERLDIQMRADETPGLSLIAAAPGTTESYSTYSETTGWDVGVDSGGEFGLSYGESQTSSTTFGNFRVDYTGPGNTARWTYRMDSTGGSAQYPYDEPIDLVYDDLFDCGFRTCLHEVNEMSRSTIGLEAEAVWRADLDFDETVGFRMWHSQQLGFIRYHHTECPFFCYDYYEWFEDSNSRGFNLDVDFSQVHPYGPDADSDGIPDYMEGIADLDGDGLVNSEDIDADGDGLGDAQEWIDDPDDDLKPNFLDTDSDNDNFLDSQEAAAGTDPYSAFSRPDVAMANLALGRASTGGGAVVSLPPDMVDPIVIAGPPTDTDPAPGVLRITDVTATQFSAGFQEWPSEDGSHGSEDFSWLAIEPGRYATNSNSVWEAERVDITGSASWTQVDFTAPLPEVPIVLVSIQTDSAGEALAARVRNVDTDGFQVALFTEEASVPVTATETVAYFAVSSRSGSDTVVVDGEAVPTLVQQFSADHQETRLLSSFIRVAEETSLDGETEHGIEAIAALAFGTEIFVQDQSAADLDPMSIRWDPPQFGAGFEVGLVRGVRRAPGLTVPYSRSYNEPIVVAYPDDPADDAEGVVRVRPVHRTANLQRFQTEGGFGIHFQLYPNDTPNWFDECYAFPDPPRDIRYVVAESGSGQVGGLQWEAGSIYTDRYAGLDQWESIFFQAGFTQTPSVFSDLQNERCGDILGGTHSAVSSTGLDVSIDYLSQDCAYCTFQYDPEETWYEVGWLAIQEGVGATVDGRLIQVTADSVDIAYGDASPEAPTARFTWSPRFPQPGEPVQFTDTATGVVSQWSWDFGDGDSSTLRNPVHSFSSPGTYLVLQAVSSNLGIDTTTTAIEVGAVPSAIFSDDFESGSTSTWSSASQ